MPVVVIQNLESRSTGVAISAGQSSTLANSYPENIERALMPVETTLTGNGEREKAFIRAGLK